MPDVDELLRGAQDSIAAKRVYGEPVERDGTTVIPAAIDVQRMALGRQVVSGLAVLAAWSFVRRRR